jgi:hypothetical protein
MWTILGDWLKVMMTYNDKLRHWKENNMISGATMLRSLHASFLLELTLAFTPTSRALLSYTTPVTKLSMQLVLVPTLLTSLTMLYPCHPVGSKAPAYTMTARLLTSASGSALLSMALFNVIRLHLLPIKLKPLS